MIENPNGVFKVLVLQYPTIRFLINRNQCSSSVFISTIEPRSKGRRWLEENLVLGEMYIPLFDLDTFLCDCFRVQTPGEAQLALIRSWDSFPPFVQQRCIEGGMEQGTPLGFRVTSATTMKDMRAQDFSLIPVTVQSRLSNKGVIAVSLPHDDTMGYLLDLDTLVTENLLEGVV